MKHLKLLLGALAFACVFQVSGITSEAAFYYAQHDDASPYVAHNLYAELDENWTRIDALSYYQSPDWGYLYDQPDELEWRWGKVVQYEEGRFFDAERYAADYPDLAAAFGNNRAALWNHYKTSGMAEGRIVHATDERNEAILRMMDVADSITNAEMTDADKVLAVHDWLLDHCVYGESGAKYYAYGYGPILGLNGVCHDYSMSFMLFMQYLGIDARYLANEAHGWNAVKLNGQWLYLDVTWDDCYYDGGAYKYQFYLLDYAQMSSLESHGQVAAVVD